jgi:NAD(P)H-dependent FMN reductase
MPKLTVVIASTRPGRAGLPIGQWFVKQAEAHGGFEVETVDLAELALPPMDEPNHPRLQQYEHQHTKDWSAIVAGSDAFVFVMPEYNFSFTGPLKNALDYLHNEWAYKPVGLVGYGGMAAGTRAIQAIKPVLLALRTFPINESVTVPFFAQYLTEDGVFEPSEIVDESAVALLQSLSRHQSATASLRA